MNERYSERPNAQVFLWAAFAGTVLLPQSAKNLVLFLLKIIYLGPGEKFKKY
jgi:hypothetical protein